jgi:hypothetical protein
VKPDFRALRQSLADREAGRMEVAALANLWRQQATTLPAQFAQALDMILMRLESGSLFDQDSCSFSQHDMLASLRQWLQQAEQWMEQH